MGSTVVMLLDSAAFEFAPGLGDGRAVRMGEALGAFSRA
jgi:hypothetical protein